VDWVFTPRFPWDLCYQPLLGLFYFDSRSSIFECFYLLLMLWCLGTTLSLGATVIEASQLTTLTYEHIIIGGVFLRSDNFFFKLQRM